MSALHQLLESVNDSTKARFESKGGMRTLYVSIATLRANLGTVLELVHWHAEVDQVEVLKGKKPRVRILSLQQEGEPGFFAEMDSHTYD